MKTQSTFRIHRFGDLVAIDSTDMSETLYLTPAMAHVVGQKLKEYAKDAHNVPFTSSALPTVEVDGKGFVV